MFLLSILIFMMIGISVGFLGGLLGVGGGIIVVPSLLAAFYFFDISSDNTMQMAAGTSLAAMILTSSSSAWAHYKQNGVNWKILLYLIPGMILGSMLGAFLVHIFPSTHLYIIFALFLCGMGWYYLLPSKLQKPEKVLDPSYPLISVMGVSIGTLSSFFGIGGGIITVPLLTAIGLPLRNAIATSAVTGFVISLVGTISFAYLGWNQAMEASTLGYIYLPAFLTIGICAFLAAPQGAKYAYIFPQSLLKKIFGLFLLSIGVMMISARVIG
jgi:uncharacterized membrane protein YfcA